MVAVVLLLAALLLACPAHAESVGLVPDPGRNLTYTDLAGPTGQALEKEVHGPVLASTGQGPFWLLLDAQAKGQDLVLDFGDPLAGRAGFIRGVSVYVLGGREGTLLGQARIGGAGSWAGAHVPITLREAPIAGETLRLAIFVEPEAGTPLDPRLAPRLVTTAPGALPPAVVGLALALAAMAGAALGAGALRRWAEAGGLALCYLAWSGLVLLLGTIFVAPPGASALAFALAALATLAALAAWALFLRRTGQTQPGLAVLSAAGLLSLLAAAAGILLPGPHNPMLFGAVLLLPPLGAGAAAAAGALQREDRSLWLAAGSWAGAALGVGAVGLLPLPLGVWVLAAGLLAHGGLLVAALLAWDLATQRRAGLLREQKLRRARTLTQIKRKEETQEQAHLLRVIERERELMTELREREQDRAEQMRLAKEVADEANRAKSAFLAVVSHEIRTPMTGVLGMLRLLEKAGLTREQKDYVMTMRRSSDAMMKLLNDILDLEKAGSGQMDMESIDFDLPQLIGSVVTLMSAHAGEKGLYLKSDLDPSLPRYVVGDPGRLRQVFLNLVSNAIKFTGKGGVTLSAKPSVGGGITFAVRDTGIGIPPEVQVRLFTPFTQAESSTARRYGGTGLGLAICKQIIAAMGSEIRIESPEGRGTAFLFTLSLPEGQADRASAALFDAEDGGSSAAVPPMRILVVEDNTVNQRIIGSLLEAHGHEAISASTAEEALDLAKAQAFGAIIMDVNLGGMNGMEATRTLRALPLAASARTPVVALTGNVGAANIRACYEAGMNAFVPKPVRPADLYAALAQVYEGTLDNPVGQGSVGSDAFAGGDLALDFVLEPGAPTLTLPPQTAQEIWEDLTQPLEMGSPAPSPGAEADPSALNIPMLRSLADSLGQDQVLALMEGFWEKAAELVSALTAAAGQENTQALGARGHELKGMAGNFGMEALSQIAAQIERTAKIGQTAEAAQLAAALPESLARARGAFDQWAESGE